MRSRGEGGRESENTVRESVGAEEGQRKRENESEGVVKGAKRAKRTKNGAVEGKGDCFDSRRDLGQIA